MTERLADIQARKDNVAQLEAVVTAMRGIAAARVQQSRGLLGGIQAYTRVITAAMGQALRLVQMDPAPPPPPKDDRAGPQKDDRAIVVFGAEQGLAGGFSNRVLDTVDAQAAQGLIFMVGTRAAAGARERGMDPHWTCRMASQAGGVPAVGGRIAEALYEQIAKGNVAQAEMIYPRLDEGRKIHVARVPLFPLDFRAFPKSTATILPLVNLPPGALIEHLTGEYVYAQLCEAAMQAFAAENQARMDAMSAAAENIDRMLDDMGKLENRVRQEEVTAEIVELAAGVAASRP